MSNFRLRALHALTLAAGGFGITVVMGLPYLRIERLERRVQTVEARLGISPPVQYYTPVPVATGRDGPIESEESDEEITRTLWGGKP